ncbi:MAG: hypothetical protein JJU40_01925 [Rhodobacteraceae bacterium]|nr:hypothetical protein [Paracoccaceae bacterium]
MSANFLERLEYRADIGVHLDETRRYILIRPEAIMGLFRRLEPGPRAAALEAFGASIFEQGSDSARAYQEMGGGGEALVRTVEASAPQLGWGIWEMVPGEGRLDLTVRNSPFAVGFGPSDGPVCHAILGMFRAVAGMVLGGEIRAAEVECAATGAPFCRFEAIRIDEAPG